MFLDRDGVLNARPPEHEYVMSADQFDWLPGAREAVVELKRAGWKVAVVSNQRGVARGLVSPETLAEIEQRIQADLGSRRPRSTVSTTARTTWMRAATAASRARG